MKNKMKCQIIRLYKIGIWKISIKKQSNEYTIYYKGSDEVRITEVIHIGICNLKVPNDPTIYK